MGKSLFCVGELVCLFLPGLFGYSVCRFLTLLLLDRGLSDSLSSAAGDCRLAPSPGWCCWAGPGALSCGTMDASCCDAVNFSDWWHGCCFLCHRSGVKLQKEKLCCHVSCKRDDSLGTGDQRAARTLYLEVLVQLVMGCAGGFWTCLSDSEWSSSWLGLKGRDIQILTNQQLCNLDKQN